MIRGFDSFGVTFAKMLQDFFNSIMFYNSFLSRIPGVVKAYIHNSFSCFGEDVNPRHETLEVVTILDSFGITFLKMLQEFFKFIRFIMIP